MIKKKTDIDKKHWANVNPEASNAEHTLVTFTHSSHSDGRGYHARCSSGAIWGSASCSRILQQAPGGVRDSNQRPSNYWMTRSTSCAKANCKICNILLIHFEKTKTVSILHDQTVISSWRPAHHGRGAPRQATVVN